MKTKRNQLKYIEWLNAEDMHDNSKKWLSELEFIKDEELFFNDLIKSYTLQLINSNHFAVSKELVVKLSKFHKETDDLVSIVKTHERTLKIMVDGIDQLKEEDNYKKEHQRFTKNINQFLKKYRAFKTQFFNLIKNILKEQKQKLLSQ